MMRIFLGAVAIQLLLPVSATAAAAPNTGPSRILTFDDRVAAQRAIEDVYWRRRIWPKENGTPKPGLATVMSEGDLRAKVADYLAKSRALEEWWRRPIAADQLQAEMERMTKHSRDPMMLRELFAALENDPFVIAETLVRRTLTDRLIRNWYANDPRFQGEVESAADAARAICSSVDCMREMGGEYFETTWRLGGGEISGAEASPDDSTVSLDAEEWKRRLDIVAVSLGASPETLPVRSLSGLEHTGSGFAVTAVLSKNAAEMTIATTVWPKRSFDAWWAAERARFGTSDAVSLRSFILPEIASTECTNDSWTLTPLDVPDMRSRHTAVWTGTEMIVWGGASGSSTYLNTGGRYDPSTDTWTATSIGLDVPVARARHTAVWTGTEMIVWGGGDGSTFSRNDGGRYNPSTDQWVPTSIGANVPAARYDHAAVWTGTEMIVWGGYTRLLPDDAVNTGGRYNPTTDSWAPTSTGANVPPPRGGHTAVWTGAEMIVWGGGSRAGNLITGGRYNPSTDSWQATSTAAGVPSSGGSHTAVWTGAVMIIWGGFTGGAVYGSRYDPSTDHWNPTSTGTNVAPSRHSHTAVWTGTEMIIWGGYPFTKVGGRYHPSTDSWSPMTTSNAPYGRQDLTGVWTGSEMIVWGGDNCGQGCPAISDTGGRYNPVADSWVPTATEVTVPGARQSHTAVWTGTEMIVWGGRYGEYANPAILNTGSRYAPATDSWTPTSVGANVPSARQRPSSIWTGREMIIWGGLSASNGVLNDGGRYDPFMDRWTPTSMGANVPAGRLSHSIVWTGRDMIVWGGSSGTSTSNTGGRYDPFTDRWMPTSTGTNVPTGRSNHTAVWTGTEMIVWGGYYGNTTSTTLNSGGRYDPFTDRWTGTSTGANVPAARGDQTAVWTGSEMIVWGGRAGSSRLNTGGRYAPSLDNWGATSTAANVPAARVAHTAVWTGREMIVWGGTSSVWPWYWDTGGRYDPVADRWVVTSTLNVPPARAAHTSVWTGTEMIVWGGFPYQSTAGRYCACPNGTLVYRDEDGDGFGDSRVSIPICDGPIPVGYLVDGGDCNDSDPTKHPGAIEVCNGIDDNCDGQVDEDASGEDADGDGIHDLCDNCLFGFNSSQSDIDHDGVGDVCDVSDGLIWEWRDDKTSISWQPEQGPTSWNLYVGDLGILRATGVYTQVAGSNPLAARGCGQTSTFASDSVMPVVGEVSFSLVTGVTNGVEGSLGSSSSGPRSNSNPCP